MSDFDRSCQDRWVNDSHEDIPWHLIINPLLLLGEHSRRYRDLNLKLDMDSDDLDRALDEGLEYGLWTSSSDDDLYSTPPGNLELTVYELTAKGEQVYAKAESFGLANSFLELRKARVSHSSKRGMFKCEMESNGSWNP